MGERIDESTVELIGIFSILNVYGNFIDIECFERDEIFRMVYTDGRLEFPLSLDDLYFFKLALSGGKWKIVEATRRYDTVELRSGVIDGDYEHEF